MQCPNCQFENMPGSAGCARCGSSLGLATAVMDVRPPRAGAMRKRFRRVAPVSRLYYAARDGFTESPLTRAGAARVGPLRQAMFGDIPPLGALGKALVPGWPQFAAGNRVRGHVFVWSFVLFLVPGLLYMGTGWGSFLIGMAFSVHSSSVLDALSRDLPMTGVRGQVARSILISILLLVLVYLPIGWLITRFASPFTLGATIEPFKEGDVVWVNQWAFRNSPPRVGQVVLYNSGFHETALNVHGRAIFYGGERIDRIVAGPGDSVRWENGVVYVNGKPTLLRPLNPAGLPPKLQIPSPARGYVILPSTSEVFRHGNIPVPPSLLEEASEVQPQEIRGTVWLRSQPLSRFWWVE